MIVAPSLLLPSVGKKVQIVRTESEHPCTLFSEYKPKPGGQTELWENLVEFGLDDRSIDISPSYRGLYVRGGRGGGKSHVGAAIACTRAYFDSTSRGLISANEYGQLETSTLVALAEFCEQFHVPLFPCGETVEETARLIARRRLCQIFDAQVLVLAGSKFGGTTEKTKQGGRGIQCRWAWLDEWTVADRIAVNVLNAALGRGRGLLEGFFWITSTINLQTPYNWCWELFDDPDRTQEKKDLYKSVVVLSTDNDALPDSFVKTLESSYTPEMIAIELRGEYATSKDGLVFNHFSRSINLTTRPYDHSKRFFISFDFNRHPATCIIGQQPDAKTLHIHEEFYLKNSDTFALSQAVRDRLDQLKPQQTHIYGDATGRAKTANSQQSNWDIVYQAMAGMMIKKCVPTVNPPVIDTVNTVNALLFHQRLTIDPKCKELIKDLETVKFDRQGNLDKKTDLMRCQVVDDLRYLAHGLLPIAKQPSTSVPVGAPLANPFGKR